MREIKFRAWNASKRVMIYDTSEEGNEELFKKLGCQWAKEIKVCHDRVLRESAPDMGYYGGGYWDDLFTDECQYMQYTGLKDRNGVEIYEGDIVEGNFPEMGVDRGVVVFEQGFQVEIPGIDDLDNLYDWTKYTSSIEVLGNIHDNPELVSTQ